MKASSWFRWIAWGVLVLALAGGGLSERALASWSVWKGDGSAGWTVKGGSGASQGSGSASGWTVVEGKGGSSNPPASPQPPAPEPEEPSPGGEPQAPEPGPSAPGGQPPSDGETGSPKETTPPEETTPGSETSPASPQVTIDRSAETYLLEKLNEERKAAGRDPLLSDASLVALARKKARDMAANQYFSHISPTYGSVFDMLQAEGIRYKWAGENIGRGASVASIHRGFVDSPEHRANLLSAGYTHVGIGVVRYRGKVYVAQVFMKPR